MTYQTTLRMNDTLASELKEIQKEKMHESLNDTIRFALSDFALRHKREKWGSEGPNVD